LTKEKESGSICVPLRKEAEGRKRTERKKAQGRRAEVFVVFERRITDSKRKCESTSKRNKKQVKSRKGHLSP
jgi:hypothetical protein